MHIKWDPVKAQAGLILTGSLGAGARGYLAGLAGQDPYPEREFCPTDYEEGWYQGYEEHLNGKRGLGQTKAE